MLKNKFLLLLTLIIVLPLANATLGNDLVSYWKLDNDDLTDYTGNNDLTNMNTVNSSGIIISGRSFDGSGDNLNATDNLSLNFDNSSFTINLWLNRTGVDGGQTLWGKAIHVSPFSGLNIRGNGDGGYQATVDNVKVATSGIAVNDSQWHMLTLVKNSTYGYQFYTDGSATGSSGIRNSNLTTNTNLTLGYQYGWGSYYNGWMDEIGVWKGNALTSSEIVDLYNSGSGKQPPFSSVVINSPENGSVILSGTQTNFSFTADGGINELVNSSLFVNSLRVSNKSLSGVINSSFFLHNVSTQQTHIWNIEVCNNQSLCFNSTNYFYDVINILDGTPIYTSPVSEGLTNTFTTNQTVASGYSITGAIFEYDGTNYSTSISFSSPNYTISSTISAPLVSADTNKTFRFWIETNGSYIPRTQYNQTVSNLNFGICGGVSNDSILNMSLFDEVSKAAITGTIEVDAEVIETSSGSVISSANQSFSGVHSAALCFSPIASYSSYDLNTEIRYTSTGYEYELYHIQDADITANTTLSLYPLNSSSSTRFSVTYQDSTYNFVDGAIVQLMRKYISDGVYEVVEAPITSSDGTTVLHIDLDAVKYRAVVVKDGEVLDTFDNLVFECQSILTGECEKKLLGDIDPQNDLDYETQRDLVYSITETNNTLTISFTTPSSLPATIRIEMSQQDQFGNTTLCNQTLTSSSGSIDCTYDATIGDSYLTLKIFKNGEAVGIHTYFVPEANGIDWLNNNFIIIFLLMVSLVGMAISSPEWIVINSVITLTLSGLLFLANGLNFVMGLGLIMWLFVAAIIIIIKLAKQEDR